MQEIERTTTTFSFSSLYNSDQYKAEINGLWTMLLLWSLPWTPLLIYVIPMQPGKKPGDVRNPEREASHCMVTKLDLFTSHLLIISAGPLISGPQRVGGCGGGGGGGLRGCLWGMSAFKSKQDVISHAGCRAVLEGFNAPLFKAGHISVKIKHTVCHELHTTVKHLTI